ncbi:MAG: peptidyl-alpha-hydroxyglycine alpha-amidating lyase family protein [Dehalococcoidales bacterium]|jgi:DNA-binding beta-propeller fold protein YncE|nr:peptidyl-alpha-hydroxyglycine alpha-amidating lyase family protein [Dehalococcoidales bacterium]MDP7286016.1 peptidyl-alpha-hydroxyglycine alpha-amidating lyase family protein [Dehalococcoidales bacterium]MDP7415290.1 peptidyl-alpha-hydroxyglycine alpha-amidating lyase family protein [Dehalococcoidales bacterium]
MIYGSGQYTYELVDGWAKLPSEWTFKDVCSVTTDAQDRVYLLNRGEHPVVVFDREGNFLYSWGEDLFTRAHGSGMGRDGSIYCTDDMLHVVYKFTLEGKLLQTLGNKRQPSDTGYAADHTDFFWSLTTIARSAPPFNRPTGVAVAGSGAIYVSDGYGNARVHKFSPEGELLLSWGEPGYEPGHFRLPHDIWVDRQERVWVPDRENSRIQIFSAQGEFLTQWEDFIRPTDLFIDEEGTVYVCELCERVSIFNSDGQPLARWGNGAGKDMAKTLFIAPHTIAVDSRGDVYVGEVSYTGNGIDRGARTVQKFARKT